MGSDSIDQKTHTKLIDKVSFLANAITNQAAVWTDFRLKTNFSKPFIVLIEPTLRCPMCCKYCDLSTDITYPKESELTLAQWKRILTELQISSRLIHDVFISGGEPFLRPDMCDIIEFAHSLGLGTRIVTIGSLCNQAVCDRLLNSPMKWLKFSIHSAQASTHDRLVGRKVHGKAIEAIQYLTDHNYAGHIGILTTVWEGNVRTLGDIALLAQQLGVDSVFYRPLFGNTAAIRRFDLPVGIHPDCIVRDPAIAQSAIEELKNLKRQGAPIANTDHQLDLIVAQIKGLNKGLTGCHMMYESIYIRPNGDVEICGHMSLGTIGNVANQPLNDILNSPEAYSARHNINRFCRCQGNAFVRKSLREKLAIVTGILGG